MVLMVRIRVPATTANLGPAFDVAGMALGLYNSFNFYEDQGPSPYDESNLIFYSAKYLYDRLGKDVDPLRIEVDSDVPSSRGLGSSATCIIGGLTGANEVLGRPLSQEDILAMATEIEGHPDNVAPALMGGCVFSTLEGGRVQTLRLEGLEGLMAYVAIPDFELATSLARDALPDSLTYGATVFNMSRIPFLMEGLRTSDIDLVILGSQDQVHQPYRKGLIRGYDTMKKIEERVRGRMVISGAGPSLLLLTDREEAGVKKAWEDLGQETGDKWRVLALEIDQEGARVL